MRGDIQEHIEPITAASALKPPCKALIADLPKHRHYHRHDPIAGVACLGPGYITSTRPPQVAERVNSMFFLYRMAFRPIDSIWLAGTFFEGSAEAA